jgi:uncharacterized RDD family membrane protein YckC
MFPAGDEIAAPAVPAGLTLAPIRRRIGGLALDEIIIVVPVAVVAVALGFTPTGTPSARWVLGLIVAVTAVAFVYETAMIAVWGRTVGKFATGTRVVRRADGGRPDWWAAVMRSLVPLTLGAIPQFGLFLGAMVYAQAFWNPLRQGLHDKAAGTLVVLSAPG